MSVRRLNKELISYPKDGQIRYNPGSSLLQQQWEVFWSGKSIGVKITVPNEYPFQPPKMQLDVAIFHPNVHQQSMCLDSITSWSPATTITDIVTEIHNLMTKPDLSRVLNPEAAELYSSNNAAYQVKVLASLKAVA